MKDKEAKSLTKQLTRYAKVGGVVGKLATKLASQRYFCLLYTSDAADDP